MIQEKQLVSSGLARYCAEHGTHEGKMILIFLETQISYSQKLA